MQQRRLSGVAAFLLDAFDTAAPLAILGAQAVYLGQPLIPSALPDDHVQALAQLLEDKNELKTFAAFLREERLT